MRVLHVIPAVARRYGGPSQAIFEMCRALQTEGIDVRLATTDADGSQRLAVTVETEIEYQGVRSIFFYGQWGERFNYSPTLTRWLNANVESFDLVHIHAVFSHPCLSAARSCRKHAIPYIVRPLGSLDPWSMQQKALRKRVVWRLVAGRMLKEAASVHYTTNEERNLAEKSLRLDRGVVIPLAIDIGVLQDPGDVVFRREHPSLGDRPYVLALGRIDPKKNLELLINGFMWLAKHRDIDRWQLVVAGDGDPQYVESLKSRVVALGGRERIIFTGWLEGAVKASALRNASLFVLPSHQENFGIAAAEALACGVPVVLSEHVNLAPEIARAKAGWVTSLEEAEFLRTLEEALAGGDERRLRGQAGMKFVEHYLSWAKSAADLKKLYSSIVRRLRPEPTSLEETEGCVT